MASSSHNRRRRSRIRSTTARRSWSSDRSTRRPSRSDGADARAYRDLFAPYLRRHAPTILMAGAARAVRPPASVADGALRPDTRFSPRRGARAAAVSRRAHARDVRRRRGAQHGAARQCATAGYALGLIVAAHAVGWPVARGGSQRVADALASYLRSLGGEIGGGRACELARPVAAVARRAVRRHAAAVPGHGRPAAAGRLAPPGRYRYGPGVFKMDWALNAPVPWARAAVRAPARCTSAGLSTRSPAASVRRGKAARRAAVRARRAADVFDPYARAGGPAHAVGVLPRAEVR